MPKEGSPTPYPAPKRPHVILERVKLDDESVWITHVNLELTTLAELPKWVERTGQEGAAIGNISCVEATLIHGRLLIEFLAGRPRKDGSAGRHPDDVAPEDFLPGWQHPDPSLFDRHLADDL